MLVARREFSLGDRRLEAGDEITYEEQSALPPGRTEALKRSGLVEEMPVHEAQDRAIEDLKNRVAKLEERSVAKTETPKRRKKAAA